MCIRDSSWRRFSWRVLGGVLAALAVSMLLAPFWPGVAGVLATALLRPVLSVVGLAALLLPLALLLLGLDLLRAEAPLSHFRRVGRGFSHAAVLGVDRVGDVVQERREGRAVARSRRTLRGELRRHLGQLEELLAVSPEHPGLKVQQGEVRGVLDELRQLSEADIGHYAEQLGEWDRTLESAVVAELENLRGRLTCETDPPAADTAAGLRDKAAAIRAGRHELGTELHSVSYTHLTLPTKRIV